jgi:hypothetical protein
VRSCCSLDAANSEVEFRAGAFIWEMSTHWENEHPSDGRVCRKPPLAAFLNSEALLQQQAASLQGAE